MYGRKRPISVQIWFLEKGREVRYAFLTTAAVASVHRKADSGEKEPGRRHEEDLIQGKKTWQKETWPKGRKYGGQTWGWIGTEMPYIRQSVTGQTVIRQVPETGKRLLGNGT